MGKFSDQVEQLIKQHDYDNLSLANVLVERHDPEKIAFYFESDEGEKRTYTYGELNELSKKFATVLKNQGVEKGSRVAVLLPKGPETFISALAIWRLGAVYVPLFTAFEKKAISYRVEHSGASVILTDAQNRVKVTEAFNDMGEEAASNITVITKDAKQLADVDDIDYYEALEQAEPFEDAVRVTKDDQMI